MCNQWKAGNTFDDPVSGQRQCMFCSLATKQEEMVSSDLDWEEDTMRHTKPCEAVGAVLS